ncbi:MAG TPA: TonB family protein [Thermoanaerobaculia bacterium]|nr:TonB family protein [Thermoanaerobaculia bacterium]
MSVAGRDPLLPYDQIHRGTCMRRVVVGFVVLLSTLSTLAGGALQPAAKKSLELADERRTAGDHAGALRAYIDAVDADPSVADLQRIERYAVPRNVIFTKRDPAILEKYKRRADEAKEPHIAALRQYLKLHPDDRNAVGELAFVLPDAEAEKLLGATLEKHPDDAVLYALRGMVRQRAEQIDTALADYEKSASLEPSDPERAFSIAAVATGFVTSHSELSAGRKRALLARAMEALGRVENVGQNPGQAAWAAYHRGAVLREQAKLESDPVRRKALETEAERVSTAARPAWRPLTAQPAATPPSPPVGPPYRVGGDVKAPVVVSRVEPVYPEEAKKARASGLVILEVLVNAEGRITQTKVVKSLPYGLDAAAEAAVRQWTFRPGTLNGEPVEVRFQIVVNLRAPAE